MTDTLWAGRKDGRGPHHAHDGWHFHRDDEGNVLVQRRVKTDDGWDAVESVIFDAAVWVSIVTETSASPDSARTHDVIAELHDA